jgi:glycerol uptake facilitator-like aquaporin
MWLSSSGRSSSSSPWPSPSQCGSAAGDIWVFLIANLLGGTTAAIAFRVLVAERSQGEAS